MAYIGDIRSISFAQGATILQSILNNRPDPGFENTLFIATDTNTIYRDNGTTWDTLSSSGGVLSGGTLTGSLILAHDPTLNLEAATKQYVDNAIQNVTAGNLDEDLTAIANLSGTSGFLKKTGTGTWSLDTNNYLTSNQSILISGDASGNGSTAITLTLANSGVTAGTYSTVTVDAKGRVTSGSTASEFAPSINLLSSGAVTLSVNKIYRIIATTSTTFTLPANPVAGDYIILKDGESTSATVQHTINRNGKNIQGLAEDLVLDTPGFEVEIWYNGTEWRLF